MNPSAPISLVTAGYGSRDAALRDFEAVWGTRREGDFHHTAVALLSTDPSGTLRVERSSSTAEHLLWGGALLGGAVFVLAPAAGAEMLATAGLSGVGAIVYHLRRNTDPAELAEAARLLDEGTCGLAVVVVNRRGAVLTPLLAHAERSGSVDLLWGELEEELGRDFATPLSDMVLLAT